MKRYALRNDGRLSDYEYLWKLTPDRWAWEYLRRNRAFRQDASLHETSHISEKSLTGSDIVFVRSRVPQKLATRWGLVLMADPHLTALDANAVWSKPAFPDQVEVNCTPRAPEQVCEFYERTTTECQVTHITDQSQREFLLVRGNETLAQVRCTGMSLLSVEPVRMKLQFSGMTGLDRKIKALEDAFHIFDDSGLGANPLWTKRTQILRDGLVALDCLEEGMSRRDIACVLHGHDTVAREWSGRAMKCAMRYLVNKAEALRDGGYLLDLLGTELASDQLERTFRFARAPKNAFN